MISIRRSDPKQAPELLEFLGRSFGRDAYQAHPDYLEWLYARNPWPHLHSPWVAQDKDGRIVGILPVMYMVARGPARSLRVHSLQNLIVDESVRAGAGLLLVKRAMKDADITVFPGVAEPLAQTYRVLKYPEIATSWCRMVLRPAALAVRILLARLGNSSGPLRISPDLLRRAAGKDLEITATPSVEQLRNLAQSLTMRDAIEGQCAIDWDVKSVMWRFFDPIGPRHLLMHAKRGGQQFCVASFGLRRGVPVARLVEVSADADERFMREVLTALRGIGACICLSYAARDLERRVQEWLGFRPVLNGPSSFVRSSLGAAESFALTAGATDYGFESILTRIESPTGSNA